jgi:effector-binding domain-containing protein
MEYQVQLVQVEPQPTAVVRRRAKQSELPQVVPQGCGEVWEFVRAANLPRPGRNLALYLDGEINVEIGVEVFHPFTGNDKVLCSNLPAGTVATTTHFGPYNRLGQAHAAILKWCADHGHALAGPSWEVYGHWNDDPAQVRTDVFYLIATDGTRNKHGQT